MKAVVLAAGRGERMQPLAQTRPKPMIPIVNTPLVEHIIRALKRARVEDILIVTGFLAEEIENYFGDGSDLGVKISYVRQTRLSGTAKAAELSRDFVGTEPFLLVYGDIVTEVENYIRMVEAYRGAPSSALISLASVPNPMVGGMVFTQDGRVTKILEKPKHAAVVSNLINAGIYIFDSAIFKMIERTELSERGEYELTTSIQKLIDNDYSVRSFRLSGFWSNVGTPEEMLLLNKIILEEMVQRMRSYGIKDARLIGEGTLINRGADIEMPAIIGKNCEIGKCYIRRYSCIHNGVKISDYAEVGESAILPNSCILDNSKVMFAAIGSAVRINKNRILIGTPEKAVVVSDNMEV